MKIRFVLGMLVVAHAMVACDGCQENKDAVDGTAPADAGLTVLDVGGAQETPSVTLTADLVTPIIRAVPAQEVVPSSVIFEFARPVISDAPHAAGGNTVVAFEPEVPGRLHFRSNSTLEFQPDQGFEPGTRYTVKVTSVESVDGALTPEKPWSATIETPVFGFSRLGGAVYDAKKGRLYADVVFSGPVDPKAVKPFAAFNVDGTSLGNVSYERGYADNVVRLTANVGQNLSATGVLGLELRAGVPHASGVKASHATATAAYRTGAPVELLAATRKEGPNGYYVEMVCNDTSAPGGTRWYWDRTSYEDYRVSRRCLPTAESLATSVHLTPEVPNLKVGSGEGGFNLIGDFSRGTYTLRIDGGMTTIDGGVLSNTFERTITVGSRTPTLRFADKGRYVPRAHWKGLALTHLNAPEVDVTIRHIPRENVVFWMSGDSETADERVANVVAREKIQLTADVDQTRTSPIDVAALIGEAKPGVYEVTVRAGAASDSVRLQVTDMNLVVKRSQARPDAPWAKEVFAWVVDMTTNKPVTDAAVSVIRKSGQSLAACKTDKDGACRLQLPDKDVDAAAPFAVFVTRGQEFTFLNYDELKVTPADARVQGSPYLSETPYIAAFWGDRDIYRPGETAHVVAAMRDGSFKAPAGHLPVEVVLKDARNQIVRKEVVHTNAAGLLTLDHRLNDFAATGSYAVDFVVAKRRVGTYHFKVEEFVPERMSVTVTSAQDNALVADLDAFAVAARYLFGGSAEGSDVELRCRVEPAQFKAPGMPEFHFGPASDAQAPTELGTASGTLDAEGHASLQCPGTGNNLVLSGPADVVAQAAVFEAGSGRTTVNEARVAVHPSRHYVGLKAGNSSVEVGKSVNIEGAVVDWNGKTTSDVAEVEVEYMRLEREYWWYADDDGDSDWGQNIRPVSESTAKVPVKNGRFTLSYTPTEYATGYVLRVRVRDADGVATTDLRLESSREYGGYYWGDSREDRTATPRPTRPTTLQMETATEIAVGTPQVATFKVPFKGRLLTTVETHRVVTYAWHDVEPGDFAWSYQVDTFEPNVYVSGLLIKDPTLDGPTSYTPDRALGVTSVRVLPTAHTLDVALDVPKSVEPNSVAKVAVKVGPVQGEAFVTVAAVDEGILQLTRYKTPNLEKQLFAKRSLGVDTFETVGWALRMQSGGPSSRTGGGDDYDEEEGGAGAPGRAMPVKPVALWSGLVPVGKDGVARVDLPIPTYRGALRVMATAATATRTGSAEGKLLVKDPLVLQTTLPRFLSATDEAQIPVFVTNMTGKAGTVTVKLEVEEQAEPALGGFPRESALVLLKNGDTKTIDLAPDASGTVVFLVQAVRQAGVAKFRVTASSGTVRSFDEGIVPMRPAGMLERKTQQIELTAGSNALATYLDGWVPTSERSTIWVTSVPWGQSFDHLKYLIRYPYGCIEQTTSSTRPLLYISNFVPMVDPESVAKAGGLEAMVKSGIDRVLSMQTSDGGFGYWPGDPQASPWGTAYATHMLLDARDQGYTVPERRLNDAIAYLETEIENIAGNRAPSWHKDTEAYMHFVLARAGRPKKALALRYAESLPSNPQGEVAEHAYMAWAALYLAGDRRYEKALKNLDVSKFDQESRNRWTYYSDARRRGVVLAIFHDLFKNAPEGEALATLVGQHLAQQSSHHYTTQELTWGITALGKWIQASATAFSPPTLSANGKTLPATTTPKAGNDRTWALYRGSEYATLDVTIDKADGKVFAVVSSEGVRSKGAPRVGGNGLAIERTFRNVDGTERGVDDHKLGDLVFTEVVLRNTTNVELANVALVDRFAGGFEIENPNLGRGQTPDWVDTESLWQIDHMNVRDDRIEVFGTIPPKGEVRVVYAVRAVTAGKFVAPGPSAEGMYRPDMWAAEAPARVEVAGPWADYLN